MTLAEVFEVAGYAVAVIATMVGSAFTLGRTMRRDRDRIDEIDRTQKTLIRQVSRIEGRLGINGNSESQNGR